MNQDQVAGAAQRVAGKLQAEVGDLTGDAKSQVEGRARDHYGEAQQALGNLKQSLGDLTSILREQVRETPFAALLVAGALGWLIGRMAD